MKAIQVDGPGLYRELDELGAISDDPAPAVCRVLYTPRDLEGRAYVHGLAEAVGLQRRIDAVGNTFYRWIGSKPDAPAVATGSHIDAIYKAGKYDGTVGVLGGIAALRALKAAGFQPKRSLEVIAFTSEEPTRFGLGCIGSRLMSGAITPDHVRGLRDAEGRDFETIRHDAGFRGDIESVRLPDDHYAAFVELHVEQGPILEAEGLSIGAVTAIAAPASYRVTVSGEGGHAGAVLMPRRRDALCGAAELALAIETAAKDSESPDCVATVGVFKPHPGAINSIPSRVHLEIDLRDIRLETRRAAFDRIQSEAARISRERSVSITFETINEDPPAAANDRILAAVERAATELELSQRRIVSRAYHDALFMARIVPTGMIFVPSKGGISHRPDEYTSQEEIERGVGVLAHTMAQLSEAP